MFYTVGADTESLLHGEQFEFVMLDERFYFLGHMIFNVDKCSAPWIDRFPLFPIDTTEHLFYNQSVNRLLYTLCALSVHMLPGEDPWIPAGDLLGFFSQTCWRRDSPARGSKTSHPWWGSPARGIKDIPPTGGEGHSFRENFVKSDLKPIQLPPGLERIRWLDALRLLDRRERLGWQSSH